MSMSGAPRRSGFRNRSNSSPWKIREVIAPQLHGIFAHRGDVAGCLQGLPAVREETGHGAGGFQIVLGVRLAQRVWLVHGDERLGAGEAVLERELRLRRLVDVVG